MGLAQNAPLPEQYELLWASGVFDHLVRLPEMPEDSGIYWSSIVSQLPDSLSAALVIPAGVQLTDDILRLSAMLDERTCAVFPMGVAHEIARSLMSSRAKLNLSATDINVWLNRYALGRPLEMPALAGFCGWLNVVAVKASAREVKNDMELSSDLRERGQSLLLSDEAFVDDAILTPISIQRDRLPEPLVDALVERHPYTAIRHPLSELNEQEKRAPESLARGPAAILHISHSWGGGLGRWVSDFCAADKEHLHIVLRSIGTREASAQALALYLGDEPVPLKQWTLTTPFQSTSLGSWEYRQILREIQTSFSIRAVVVSSLIGHSLDLYEEPWPIIQVLHDYYPWCPPLYATWKDPCVQCDADRLGQCLKSNSAHQFFGEEQVGWFVALRKQLVALLQKRDIPLVAPSPSVRERWRQLAPPLREMEISVIGHGLPASTIMAFSEHRWENEPESGLHIVTLGVLSEHKGGGFLAELLPGWLSRCRVTLVGTGEQAPSFPRHANLRVIKWFQLPDLPRLLQELKPDVGLLLSTVPETFSYTLSELFAAGIPPVATDLGAFSDRIREGENGWLVAPHSESIKQKVDWLSDNRKELVRVREALLTTQQRSTEDVVGQYLQLLPPADVSLISRPLCRSVVSDLGVRLDQGEPSQKALFVRPGASYRLALFQFLMYSKQKIQSSPRLSRPSKWLFSLPLRLALKLSKP